MARSGLHDFLWKEQLRRAGRPQTVKPLDAVIESSQGTPYKLPDESSKMLKGVADQRCFRCKGTGVSKWRRSGTMAQVCRCVQAKLPAMQKALEEQQKRLEAELAEAQAEKRDEQGGPATVAEGEARKEG